jgi:hypothetical protein
MGALVVLSIIGFIIYLIARSSNSSSALPSTSLTGGGMDCYTLLRQGVPAAGILVRVGTQRTLWGTASPGYFEARTVSIDVELPGQQPYRIDGPVFVPANMRRLILPGATVELRVDPSSRGNIAVYGPGVGLPVF